MSGADWVAVDVRARAMATRRLGRAAARRLAGRSSLAAAVAVLHTGPYERFVRDGQDLAGAQRGVVRAALWNVRVLAGWAPRDGVAMLRALCAAVEAANVVDLLARLRGAPVGAPYPLGALATAWPRLERAADPVALRRELAASPWGDPGGTGERAVALALRAAAAERVCTVVPPARGWAVSAAALLAARELGGEFPEPARATLARVLGRAAADATSLPALHAALPAEARWTLAATGDPQQLREQLWRAEARWWLRVEADGLALTRRPGLGAAALVGAVGLLAADAWRVRGALQLAARGGARPEQLDAGWFGGGDAPEAASGSVRRGTRPSIRPTVRRSARPRRRRPGRSTRRRSRRSQRSRRSRRSRRSQRSRRSWRSRRGRRTRGTGSGRCGGVRPSGRC